MTEKFKQLNQEIDKYNSFAIITHLRPDGDALGSSTAFGKYLESQNKQVDYYCLSDIPENLKFIPGSSGIKKEFDDNWHKADVIVVVDCGDISMADINSTHINNRPTITIDHHISNTGYGDLNILDSNSAATAEIIFEYFGFVKFKIDKNIATQLLVGIYTDTDSFSNLGTTPASLASSSELLSLGANFKEITANTIQNKSVASLKLWGRALERLRIDHKKGIAITVIKYEDLSECQAKPEDMEGVANLLNHLADVKMSMVLREQEDGTVKGSLRTTSELIDVSNIAKLMGGGGHAKASGFTVKGKIVETEQGWKIVE
jgi:bifunctional oligoribonuclease and PAP phosphatase NrnA